MFQSREWWFHAWPLDLRAGIRTTQLGDITKRLDAAPREVPVVDAISTGNATTGGQLGVGREEMLDWESEGGSVG